MHDNQVLVERRFQRCLRDRILPAVYRRTAALEISAWEAPGEPVPFAEAIGNDFTPFRVGAAWGRPWSTVWLHVTGTVPSSWDEEGTRPEIVVDLGFDQRRPGFQAEALAWTPDGVIVKAVEPLNNHVPVAGAGAFVDLYFELAANPDLVNNWAFTPTPFGDKGAAGNDLQYVLERLEFAQLDVAVWELAQDAWTLLGLLDELPTASTRRATILRALDAMVDTLDPDAVSATAAAARAVLAPVLASPANASSHRVAAVGHAHIDSAWLWPVRETVRKVARTFSNVLALMAEDPDVTFAASSAQQYAWMQEYYPELFERVKAQVVAGRFVPVGGMWVESDTNMPGGEALVRQFVAGKRYFIEQLGVEPLEVWLPDSFGYTGSLPQIVTAAGSRWFLTQKLSWNETNRMPHHTFLWEGIDGTRVFTHFPPVDMYNSELSGKELAHAERQYAEKGEGTVSLVPFGWGDGGGGPTREMVAAAIRTHDLEGSPRVTMTTPRRFFEDAQAEYPQPPVWSGELYLEFHRGTFTSQAKTKRGNRKSEHLLREAELWATTASVRLGIEYPYRELETVWRTVLLQQFHDILPGSSIAWVHREAERNYEHVAESLEMLISASISRLAGEGKLDLAFNAGPYPRDGVGGLGAAIASRAPGIPIRVDGDSFVLESQTSRVVIDGRGLVVSMTDLASDREAIPAGVPANLLQLFRDVPTQWDAWDIDEHYRRVGVDLVDVTSIEITADGAGLRIERSFGRSHVSQELRLNPETGALDIAHTIDWHESQKLLKLAFPLDIHAERAASEIQFGHIFRPTHTNTSWDAARFETVAHRWVHVSDASFGAVIANDASYGHDIHRTALDTGGFATIVRVSLLRAPLFPDPGADQGRQQFVVSLRLGAGIPQAVAEGYRVNLDLRHAYGAAEVAPLVTIDSPAIVVEAVKLAEDRSGDVIVRLYEAFGGRATGTLVAGFDCRRIVETDLLEREIPASAVRRTALGEVGLVLRPFQLVTLRFLRGG